MEAEKDPGIIKRDTYEEGENETMDEAEKDYPHALGAERNILKKENCEFKKSRRYKCEKDKK